MSSFETVHEYIKKEKELTHNSYTQKGPTSNILSLPLSLPLYILLSFLPSLFPTRHTLLEGYCSASGAREITVTGSQEQT